MVCIVHSLHSHITIIRSARTGGWSWARLSEAWPRVRGPSWCSERSPTTNYPARGRTWQGEGTGWVSRKVCTSPSQLSPSRQSGPGNVSETQAGNGLLTDRRTNLPPEIGEIFLLVSGKFQQEFCQLLRGLIVQNIDIGLRGSLLLVFCCSQDWSKTINWYQRVLVSNRPIGMMSRDRAR